MSIDPCPDKYAANKWQPPAHTRRVLLSAGMLSQGARARTSEHLSLPRRSRGTDPGQPATRALKRFLDREAGLCAEPSAVGGRTHLLFAAAPVLPPPDDPPPAARRRLRPASNIALSKRRRSGRTLAEPPIWRRSLPPGGADRGAQSWKICAPIRVLGRLSRRAALPAKAVRSPGAWVMPGCARSGVMGAVSAAALMNPRLGSRQGRSPASCRATAWFLRRRPGSSSVGSRRCCRCRPSWTGTSSSEQADVHCGKRNCPGLRWRAADQGDSPLRYHTGKHPASPY